MILTMIEPRSAIQKLETENPSTNDATNKKSSALITKIKSPRVNIVIGRVKRMRTGRTRAFTTPRKNAAISAGKIPSTVIPGTNFATKRSANAVTRMRVNIFIL